MDSTAHMDHISGASRQHNYRCLKREAAGTGTIYVLATGAIHVVLRTVWSPASAWRWLALSSAVLVYIIWMMARRLTDNHPPGSDALYSALGAANHISLMRGLLLAWLAGFIFSPWPDGWLAWVPGALYTLAIVIDYTDGLVARLMQHTSVMGQSLDMELDALGILIAPALGIWWGQLPPWYALVALAYYAFIIGKWLRAQRGLVVYVLPPSRIRRPMAGIQMGFISAVLWPVLRPPMTTAAATLVMVPFIAGFIRDWFVVSGMIDSSAQAYRTRLRYISNLMQHWLPLLLRVMIATVFGYAIVSGVYPDLFGAPTAVNAVLILVFAGLAVTGIVGRLSGTLLAIWVSVTAARWGWDAASGIIIGCGLGLMLLGTGIASPWQPEEVFLQSHYGGNDKPA